MSNDNTVSLALSLGAIVSVIDRQTFDHGGTRNMGARMSTSDILVFMTQDAIPFDDKTIENLVAPLEEPEIVLSYARQVPKPGTKITDEFLRLYNYPPQSRVKSSEDIAQSGIGTFQNSNVCAAYRKKEFILLGEFVSPIVCNEDMLFASKAISAGYKVSYTAGAVVQHSHNYGYKDLFKRYFDIGASLDGDQVIRQVGKTEAKGYDFLIEQVKYLKARNKLRLLPQVFWEATSKYIGYKLGERHNLIPGVCKKYLGLNRVFWTNQSNNRNNI